MLLTEGALRGSKRHKKYFFVKSMAKGIRKDDRLEFKTFSLIYFRDNDLYIYYLLGVKYCGIRYLSHPGAGRSFPGYAIRNYG